MVCLTKETTPNGSSVVENVYESKAEGVVGNVNDRISALPDERDAGWWTSIGFDGAIWNLDGDIPTLKISGMSAISITSVSDNNNMIEHDDSVGPENVVTAGSLAGNFSMMQRDELALVESDVMASDNEDASDTLSEQDKPLIAVGTTASLACCVLFGFGITRTRVTTKKND